MAEEPPAIDATPKPEDNEQKPEKEELDDKANVDEKLPQKRTTSQMQTKLTL